MFKIKWNIGSFHLLVILTVNLLSALLSPTPEYAWKIFINVFKIILPALLIGLIIAQKKDFKLIISIYAVSIGIWTVQAGLHGITTGGSVESMSIGGQMSDRNDFGVGALMTLPLLYYIGLNERMKAVKWMAFGAAFMTCVCIIVSNSRGAMLGLFIILLLNFTRRGTKRWRNFVLIIIAIPIIISLLPQFVIDRLNTIEVGAEQTESSAQSRMILMKSGINGGLANPFLGVGPGCWALHATEYIPGGQAMGDGAYEPHCIWIKMFAELGFVGLCAYLLMFSTIILSLRKIQKKCLQSQKKEYYNYSFMLQLTILAYCSAATFVNQIYFEYMFLVIAVSGAFIKSWQDYITTEESGKTEEMKPSK